MMSPPEKQGGGPTLEDLAPLADNLAEAIAEGDVQSAQEAHHAIGRGLRAQANNPPASSTSPTSVRGGAGLAGARGRDP